LYIGGVWIRQPKELNMKRLLGLLLVVGMVGCGGEEATPTPNDSQAKVDESPVQTVDASPAGEAALPATPNKPQAKVDKPHVQTVDASKLVQRDGLTYVVNSETPFTGAVVHKHENGQKASEATFKDGKPEGLATIWHKNGQKRSEATFKDDKLVSETKWDEEGNEIK
ncbi:MAG: hypothetical protein VX346_03630, partial [Planctomycetota bacterium]|nr:hypothetical protein [Planctomycetota bacterium]